MHQLVLIERDNTQGAMLNLVWKCPCCEETLTMSNCNKVKSSQVALGAKYSRMQPELNLRILAGGALIGINTQKMKELFEGHLGVKIASARNIQRQKTKVGSAIKETYEERKIENRIEHVKAARSSNNYKGDLEWERDGVCHLTSCGDISMDGAGCTRVYNHRHRGKQSAFIVNSITTGKPLALVVSQVSTWLYFALHCDNCYQPFDSAFP